MHPTGQILSDRMWLPQIRKKSMTTACKPS